MRIVQINETCGTGSIGRLSLELSDFAKKQGHDVLFVYANGKALFEKTYHIGNVIDHKLHAILSRITGLQGYFSRLSTILLIYRLKKFKPDIVHLENLHSNYINLKIFFRFLQEYDIPMIITLHDSWIYTGKCTYYVPAKCNKWMDCCGNCPLLYIDNTNPTVLFDKTKKMITDKRNLIKAIPRVGVVGVSDWIVKEAARSSVLNGKKIRTIYNWIDQDIFKYRDSDWRNKLGINGKKCVIMVAERMEVKKGYNELIYLAENLPDVYLIVFVGRSDKRHKLPSNIIHIDHTNNAIELSELYSMADVCVNTTQYESFGMVTIESMACGTPVIVYGNTASKELVDLECGAVISQQKGMKEILNAVMRICENGYDRFEIMSRTHKKFGRDRSLFKYIEFYSEIIKDKV